MVDLSTLPAIERAEQVIPAYSTYDTLALRDAPPLPTEEPDVWPTSPVL
jgi:hypothetical protein